MLYEYKLQCSIVQYFSECTDFEALELVVHWRRVPLASRGDERWGRGSRSGSEARSRQRAALSRTRTGQRAERKLQHDVSEVESKVSLSKDSSFR